MDRAVLKGLVRTLKALILELEAEVFADKDAYTKPRENYDDPVEYYNSNDDDDGLPKSSLGVPCSSILPP